MTECTFDLNGQAVMPSLEENGRVRVVVAPIGLTTATTFRTYASLLLQYRTVKLAHLTRFQEDNIKSPFKNQQWHKNDIWFQFIDAHNANELDYIEFQQHRKVNAVIGIMSCKSEGNIKNGYRKFRNLVSQFPTATVCRCFAVEPIVDDDRADHIHRNNLVVIPNQQEKLDFYMETLVNDIAAELLKVFEARAHITAPLFAGHHSLEAYKESNDSDISKRQLVRTNKIFADLALLAGDFVDAQEKYLATVELTKGISDDLEQAGALEGAASALYYATFSPFRPVDESTKDAHAELIIHHSTEAIALYDKVNQPRLACELLLKLGVFCAKHGGKAKRTVAVHSLNRMFTKSAGFKLKDRALMCSMAAKIISEIGFKRKAAMFLREAATAQQQLKNATLAKRYILLCFDAYDLPLTYSYQTGWRLLHSKAHQENTGWHDVQLQLILDFLNMSVSVQNANSGTDHLAEAQLILLLFSKYYNSMDLDLQQKLFSHLCSISKAIADSTKLCLLPLPFLCRVLPEKLPAHLTPIAKETAKPRDSVFIFNPFDAERNKSTKITLVVGEPARVTIEMHNPLLIPVKLRKVELVLSDDSVPCNVMSENCIIQSANSITICTSLTPLKVGPLSINGVKFKFEDCHIRGENLLMPWNPSKKQEIEAIGPLPLLQISQPSEEISLYAGQRFFSALQMENIGVESIESISIDIKNSYPSSLTIFEKEMQEALALLPGESLTVPVEFVGEFMSSETHEQQAQIIITYSRSDCAWYRKVSLNYKMQVRRGLVLERCIGVNHKAHRHVIAQISNYAESPFTLYPNHSHSESVPVEAGLVLAPTESKILIADSENVDPYGPIKSEKFKQELSRTFQWRSHLNTHGTVGVVPSNDGKASDGSVKRDAWMRQPKTFLLVKVDKNPEVMVEQPSESNAVTANRGSLVRVTSKVTIPMDADSEDPNSKLPAQNLIKISFQARQDVENGNVIVLQPSDFAYSGSLTHFVPQNAPKEDDADIAETRTFIHSLNLFFLKAGRFRICVDYTDAKTGRHVTQVQYCVVNVK